MIRNITIQVDDDGTRQSSILEQIITLIDRDRFMRGVTVGLRYTEDGQSHYLKVQGRTKPECEWFVPPKLSDRRCITCGRTKRDHD